MLSKPKKKPYIAGGRYNAVQVDQPAVDPYRVSAVNLRQSDWDLLQWAARARAAKQGGRPSVSAVIAELIEAKRKALVAEAGKLDNPY